MYKIPATTLFLGKNLIFVPECHSTNDTMLLLCQKNAATEGSVVVTANQTAGRGQRGNKWESEPGQNLTFTFLINPSFLAVHKQFFLNVFTTVGICDYLTTQTGPKVQIKWPNDIFVDEKKICGILIENQISANRLVNSVIGVGLNINQQQFSSPVATSLSILTKKSYDLSQELNQLLHCLERRYLQLRAGGHEQLLDSYLSNMYQLNSPSTFTDKDGTFTGTIRGIDDIGRLQVERGEGMAVYDLKEIRYGHI